MNRRRDTQTFCWPRPRFERSHYLLRFSFSLALALLILLLGGGLAAPPLYAASLGPTHPLLRLGPSVPRSSAGIRREVKVSAHLLLAGSAGSCGAGDQSYTIRPFDTLSAIAARAGTTWPVLAAHNHLANPDLIFPEQTLCIPGGAQQPAAVVGQSGLTNLIQQVFGPYAEQALQIARCESTLNPGAHNPVAIGDSHAAGLFQILYPSTWASTSQGGNSPYNVLANVLAAHEIFVRDGFSWREWECQP